MNLKKLISSVIAVGMVSKGLFSAVVPGTLPGDVTVTNRGSAVYSIPIQTVPGVAGMNPDLSLVYNSQGGNGLLGQGWSLSGLSVITRVPTTDFLESGSTEGAYTSSNFKVYPVNFDGMDRFALDGKRLMMVSGSTYGANGTEYRTEIDSFSRIKAVGSVNGGPQYFTVETKSGLKLTFGNTTDSRIDVQAYDAASQTTVTRTMTWAVNKIEDTLGNAITVSYTKSNGSFRPTLIEYAKDGTFECQVTFSYATNTSADQSPLYVGGAELKNQNRLTAIQCKEDGALIREYKLAYETSPATGKSRLTTVTLHAGGNNIPQTLFDYQDRGQSSEFTNGGTGNFGNWNGSDGSPNLTLTGDINGDGFKDIIKQVSISQTQDRVEIYLFNPSTGQFTHNSSNDKLIDATEENGLRIPPRIQFGDVNGDFKTDLVVMEYDSSFEYIDNTPPYNTYTFTETFKVYLSQGDYFASSAQSFAGDTVIFDVFLYDLQNFQTYVDKNLWTFVLADFNGDGRQDIIRNKAYLNEPFWFSEYRSNCEGSTVSFIKLGSPSSISGVNNSRYEYGIPLNDDYHYFFDANGDGMTDMFFSDKSGTDRQIRVYLSDGTGYSTSSFLTHTLGTNISDNVATSAPESVVIPADVNGDGMMDVVYAYKDTVYPYGKMKVFFFTGTRWVDGPQTSFTWNNDADFMTIDSNGDGKADLVHTYKSSGTEMLTLWRSLGNSFATPVTQSVGTWQSSRRYHQVDLNADGKADLVRIVKDSTLIDADYWFSAGLMPDLLTSVTNGLGAMTELEYLELSDPTVRVSSSETYTYPYLPYVGGLQMVHKLKTDDGLGTPDGDYVVRYRYNGGRVHLWGRGFLGFRVFETYDMQNYMTRIETVETAFPKTGMTLSVVNWFPDPVTSSWGITSYTTNTLDAYTTKTHSFGGSSHASWFPFISSSEQASKEVSEESGIDPGSLFSNYYSGVVTTNTYRDTYGNGDVYGNPLKVRVDYYANGTWKSAEETANTEWLNINTTSAWMPGRLKRSVSTFQRSGESSKTRVAEFVYAITGTGGDSDYPGSSTHGLLYQEIAEPGNSRLEVKTTYSYDTKGNITEKKTEAKDATYNPSNPSSPTISTKTIRNIFTYTSHSRFVYTDKTQGLTANSTIDQTITYEAYKTGFALPTRMRDINGLKTEIDYDSFGRETATRQYGKTSGGADTLISTKAKTIVDAGGSGPSGSKTKVTTQTTGSSGSVVLVPAASVFTDRLGRTLRTESINADGQTVYQDTEYDSFGRVWRTCEPYFSGSFPQYWTTMDYDSVGRKWKVTQQIQDASTPDATGTQTIVTKYLYDGFETTVRANEGGGAKEQDRKETVDAQGNVVRVDQEESAYMLYTYDAVGNLRQTKDPANNTTTITYDSKGRFKTGMTDPDMGTWSYGYNALGELKWQVDAAGTVTTMTYDFLGRMTQRVTSSSGGTSFTDTWTYDTATGIGKGKLASESGGDSFSKYYVYEASGFGELKQEFITVSGNQVQIGYSYDAYRRLDKIWAPQNRQIQNHYNTRGVLTKVTGLDNGSLDHTWWEATDYDAQNRITDYKLAGGNMLGERTFKGGSGLISDVQTGTSPSTSNIYRFRYSYDKLGNVTNRQQTAPYSLSEAFTYDALNRLKTWDPSTQPLVSANYNTIGNITSRSDVNGGSTWVYNSSRPHAVTTAGSNSYSYDANGRMSTRNGSSVWWLPFNKPRAIFSASNSYTFYYDNNRNRVLETVIQNGTQRSIVKYGSLYEEVADNGVDTYRLFIPTPMGVVGVWNRGDLGDQKRYHHKDLLGSVGLETNENGTVQNQYAYDPWGAPRTPSTWASLSTWPNYGSDRGYTSHEMLEGLELVHMNGRIYDPAIGRFLTADPFVQFSGDSQSYNRYSYVLNNPLRYSDPSGHFVFVLGMGAYWASAGVTTQTFGYFVATMFAAGFIDTFMMTGGDVDQALQAGAFTAAASVVTFGIGTAFESPTGGLLGALEDKPTLLALAQHTAHGISSGAFTELAGGDFGAGFAAGMAGSFGGSIAQSRGGVQGFLVATIAGGTASELGGGKFANGAISGAFVYLLNHQAHTNNKANRNALGRAKNRGTISTPVEDFFDYVGEFWTDAIIDPLAPGSEFIAAIEGAGSLFVDGSITIGGNLSAHNAFGFSAEGGLYLSWNFSDLSIQNIDFGSFFSIGLGAGGGMSLAPSVGLYNTSNLQGRSFTFNGGAGPVGGSVILDTSWNPQGISLSYTPLSTPISGSANFLTGTNLNSWRD